MTVIRVNTDFTRTSKAVKALNLDQLPFAVSKAINDSGVHAQGVQRQHQRRIFDVRNPRFVDSAVKLLRSNKRSLVAHMLVEPFGGQQRADIISKFEDQRQKLPFDGGSLAVPQIKRSSKGVPEKLRPSNLFANAKTEGNVIKGAERSFLIKMRKGKIRGLILQRRGRRSRRKKRRVFGFAGDTLATLAREQAREDDKANTRLLYILIDRAKIEPELDFEANIVREVRFVYPFFFSRAFRQAIKSSRVRVARRNRP